MKTSLPGLLYILLFFQTSGRSSNLSCLYDSFETLICTWSPEKNTAEAQCRLTASVNYGKPPKTCQMHGISIRNCTLILQGFSLTAVDTVLLAVSCCTGEKWTEIQNQKLEPFQNIQLQPPCKFQLENDSKPSYNFTWNLCVLSHYLKGRLKYEVQYRAKSPGETDIILPIAQDQTWLIIENLSPDTVFEAAIRVKVPQSKYYKSIWSKWSTSITWRTDPKEASSQHTLFLAVAGSFLILICMAIFFMVLSTTSKCFRKMLKIGLPNPAEFFPSLIGVHGGDVKKWLSSPTSITSFHITTETPIVSVLEIMQKGSLESCHLLSKEFLTHIETTAEGSGQSLSSCFTNRGYFLFHHLDSLEIDSCKVYFAYDAVTQESSSSKDGNSYSYRPFYEASDSLPLPTNNLVTNQENYVFLQETNLSQVGNYFGTALSSTENFPTVSITELAESTEERASVVLSSKTPEEFSVDGSSVSEQPSNNNDGTELLKNIGSPINTLEDKKFLFPNEVQTNDFCRTASFSQIPSSSEVYLSLQDLQRHYSHHSV